MLCLLVMAPVLRVPLAAPIARIWLSAFWLSATEVVFAGVSLPAFEMMFVANAETGGAPTLEFLITKLARAEFGS